MTCGSLVEAFVLKYFRNTRNKRKMSGRGRGKGRGRVGRGGNGRRGRGRAIRSSMPAHPVISALDSMLNEMRSTG